jgi:hypothetical protein
MVHNCQIRHTGGLDILRFFIGRTSSNHEAPCPNAVRVDVAIKDWWTMTTNPIRANAINSDSARKDGVLQLWTVEIDSLNHLFGLMEFNRKRDGEIIVGKAEIDGQEHHYIEIYDSYRE